MFLKREKKERAMWRVALSYYITAVVLVPAIVGIPLAFLMIAYTDISNQILNILTSFIALGMTWFGVQYYATILRKFYIVKDRDLLVKWTIGYLVGFSVVFNTIYAFFPDPEYPTTILDWLLIVIVDILLTSVVIYYANKKFISEDK